MKRTACASLEALTLADSADAARMIAQALRDRQFGSLSDERRAPAVLTALLEIIVARLRLFAGVLRGEQHDGLLVTPGNETEPSPIAKPGSGDSPRKKEVMAPRRRRGRPRTNLVRKSGSGAETSTEQSTTSEVAGGEQQ